MNVELICIMHGHLSKFSTYIFSFPSLIGYCWFGNRIWNSSYKGKCFVHKFRCSSFLYMAIESMNVQ